MSTATCSLSVTREPLRSSVPAPEPGSFPAPCGHGALQTRARGSHASSQEQAQWQPRHLRGSRGWTRALLHIYSPDTETDKSAEGGTGSLISFSCNASFYTLGSYQVQVPWQTLGYGNKRSPGCKVQTAWEEAPVTTERAGP